MKKIILFYLLFASVLNTQLNAQIEENPIDELAFKLGENSFLSYRFLFDFVNIQNNIFKDKAMKDLDMSIARFDENLTTFALALPDNSDVNKKYLELINYWNKYRLSITADNKDNVNYDKVISQTIYFNKMVLDFNSDFIKNHTKYSSIKKQEKELVKILNSTNEINKIGINYILDRGVNKKNVSNTLPADISVPMKHIKKLLKNKKLKDRDKERLIDMQETLKNVESLLNKKSYHPKLMFFYVKGLTQQGFEGLKFILRK